MSAGLVPFSIAVQPWFHDHRFNGRTILPAVEAMHLLALAAQKKFPGIDLTSMSTGRFSRFLVIAPGSMEIQALVGLEKEAEDEIRASLCTQQKLKTMMRTISHCEVSFLAGSTTTAFLGRYGPPPANAASGPAISAERIYRELVPFGPAYRTLQGNLSLAGEYAWSMLQAPDLPESSRDQGQLGNPFPLDGAMHAACVHGQRLVDFVPFPVGFTERRIHRPTCSGERYWVQVQMRLRTENELKYDVWIFDQAGQIRETVKGLQMRDVSGGQIKPPVWIKAL